jgi:hypothetical protein
MREGESERERELCMCLFSVCVRGTVKACVRKKKERERVRDCSHSFKKQG